MFEIKAIVLAGGYAKRLWPLTKELAKPLVDINGRPVIAYILTALDKSKHISEVLISTNTKFEDSFKGWLATQKFSKPVKVVAEPTTNEGEKLGAIGGINFVLESQNINDDIFVAGGDNLAGIDVDAMIAQFVSKEKSVVGVYDIKELGRVKQYGEVKIDKNKKIIHSIEKPSHPETTLISTCFYIFPKGIRNKINSYVKAGNNKDAPGFFVDWLFKKTDVYAYVFDSYWFDIGDHQTLEQAREFAKKNL